MLNQITGLCKLGSPLRMFELRQENIPVAFRNPMGAEGTNWTQDLMKSPSSSCCSSSQEVGGTSAPLLQREQLPKGKVTFYPVVISTPSGQTSPESSRSDYEGTLLSHPTEGIAALPGRTEVPNIWKPVGAPAQLNIWSANGRSHRGLFSPPLTPPPRWGRAGKGMEG